MATGIRIGWRKLTILALRPNHRADDQDEKNHTEGRERRPHHLSLPRCGIIAHVHCENAAGHRVGFVFVGGPLPIGALVLSILFARFLFLDRGPALFAMIPALQKFDSI